MVFINSQSVIFNDWVDKDISNDEVVNSACSGYDNVVRYAQHCTHSGVRALLGMPADWEKGACLPAAKFPALHINSSTNSSTAWLMVRLKELYIYQNIVLHMAIYFNDILRTRYNFFLKFKKLVSSSAAPVPLRKYCSVIGCKKG